MNREYIPLSQQQINQLIHQGCEAENWNSIKVSPAFDPSFISYVSFYGEIAIGNFAGFGNTLSNEAGIRYVTLKNVIIGNNVIIHHVGIIEGYNIENDVCICRVNELKADNQQATLWEKAFAVGNEAGENNIRFSKKNNDQIAWICMHFPQIREKIWNDDNLKQLKETSPTFATLGHKTNIANSGILYNISTDSDTNIQGASELKNGHIGSQSYIGAQVIANYFTIGHKSIVDGGTNLYYTIVGNYCKIGKGFTAENCYFCHHCELYCGEACAIFAGPHTVSHHKSTLLIGGEFSFFNAGSGTNQSNHAYKMGPIHYGILERGSKTASSSHILWPMHTAPFTMVMGKIKLHPDLSSLPFSYVIAEEATTYVIPGINLCTIGTYRDIIKWKERGCTDIQEKTDKQQATYDFLSPYIMQKVFAGLEILKNLLKKYGPDTPIYPYQGTEIRNSALKKGITYYQLAIRLFASKIGINDQNEPTPDNIFGTWIDIAGIPAPEAILTKMITEIDTADKIVIYETLERYITLITHNYTMYMKKWGIAKLQEYYGTELYSHKIKQEVKIAIKEWQEFLINDSYKEYNMGDVEQKTLDEFMNKIHTIKKNIL